MFGPETSARFASAAFAVVLTIASFAYAIIPASPGLVA
ncbi:MAG: enoyl-CoA hydratase [Erythrobacter sp.]|nr:enoyl-CoA hydratase [Erythrobacter sp.]